LAATARSASVAASVRSPSGSSASSLPSARAYQSRMALASAMKASARARSRPGFLSWRSGVLPWVRIASSMVARSASSEAVSGVTTPSPLKRMAASHSLRLEMSASVSVFESFLPSRSRMRRPSFARSAPAAPLSSRSSSDRVPPPASNASGLRSRSQAQRQAAMTSGGRTRPSPSVSIRSSVRGSKSMPRVGQASATHSFWSSSAMWAMSAPLRNTTWSRPPARMKLHRCGVVAGTGVLVPGTPAGIVLEGRVAVVTVAGFLRRGARDEEKERRAGSSSAHEPRSRGSRALRTDGAQPCRPMPTPPFAR